MALWSGDPRFGGEDKTRVTLGSLFKLGMSLSIGVEKVQES